MPTTVEAEIENIDISEAETIRLAQQGNAAAFEHLYHRYSARVSSICLRIVKNHSEAEDLTQEVFLLLFRKIHTFRGESKFSTWLHRLTVNLVLMGFRKKRYPVVSLDETVEFDEEDTKPLVELGEPDIRLSGIVDKMNLRRAIEQLPAGYREMFVLHDVEGYEHHEIARILGCSTGNSKSQLYKARLRLRELLKEAVRNRAREERKAARRLPAPEHQEQRLQCVEV
jgi:RNA polymerase sigma-70 factor (ECF subfamily)